MSAPERPGERLLRFAIRSLPPARRPWGDAMLAELASLDDEVEARRFARGASAAALRQGLAVPLAVAAGAAAAIALVAITASRVQLARGNPGVLPVTVPVPALVLLLASGAAGGLTRSFRMGLRAGVMGLVTGFLALWAVLAVEGMVWMDRHGVFILDGDPPRTPATTITVVLDVFTTGMWMGHALFWMPAVLLGAAAGAGVASAISGPAGGKRPVTSR